MRFSFFLSLFWISFKLFGQSPHGLGFKIDCNQCHNTQNWEVNQDQLLFNHDSTQFPLEGRHSLLNCVECHSDLKFNTASKECISCHLDLHQNSVGSDCIRCHTSSNWLVDNIHPLHLENGFELLGRHGSADCIDCHTQFSELIFTRIGNDCLNCHLTDFNLSQQPNHELSQLSKNCIECHSPEESDWKASFFNHDFFPLEQGHDFLDCVDCHQNPDYTTTSTNCVDCHQNNYLEAKNPNHVLFNLNTDCAECHSIEPGWKPASFEIHDSYFPIYSGGHAGTWNLCADCHLGDNFNSSGCIHCHSSVETEEDHFGVIGYVYEDNYCLICHPTGESDNIFDHNTTRFPLEGGHLVTDCKECHISGFTGTPTDCQDCHLQDFNSSIDPNHRELNISLECAECHTANPDWQPALFPIHDEFYVLEGAHKIIENECIECHSNGYQNTGSNCVDCHLENWSATVSPDHQKFEFSQECATCHTTNPGWSPAQFNHDEYYILNGVHATIVSDCKACHNEYFTNTPTECIGCHQQEYDIADNPNHLFLKLSTDCKECHSESVWSPSEFDHSKYFVLDGAHQLIENDCIQCHSNGIEATPNTCVGCHLENFNTTVSPDHEIFNFSKDCATCHTTNPGWSPAQFNHDEYYLLKGAHAAIANECSSCHNESFMNTPTTCFGCHSSEYNSSQNPNHKEAGFPTDCTSCHSESAWTPSSFNHDQFFPLTGGHAYVDCRSCHQSGFTNTPSDCFSCHRTDYMNTNNPDHEQLNFPQNCATCHTTNPGWRPAQFDHNQFYVLNGAHASIANECASCHNSSFTNTPTTCFGCHSSDYNSTSNPNHKEVGFPTDCVSCHSESAWTPSSFNHDQFFPLTGGHAYVDCRSCHQSGFTNTPSDCFSCHRTDYMNTNNPDHEQLNFPQNCATCHTTNPGWRPAQFDHNQFYVLNGAHASIANECASCHNSTFTNTPTTCFGCHSADYNSTTNPNHKQLNFSTSCITCHNENAWIPASFNHNLFYPLNGAHAAVANECASCHNSTFTNTPTTCFGCHSSDYNSTTNPNHKQSGFSIDCATCHNESRWEGASFNHDNQYFPIYSGNHRGEWNSCSECHTTAGNYSLFSCIDCHEHSNASELAKDHDDVNGYVFQSVSCYACHPNGEED